MTEPTKSVYVVAYPVAGVPETEAAEYAPRVEKSLLAVLDVMLGKTVIYMPDFPGMRPAIDRAVSARMVDESWLRYGVPVWEMEYQGKVDITHVVVVGGSHEDLIEVEQLISAFPKAELVPVIGTGPFAAELVSRFDIGGELARREFWDGNYYEAFRIVFGMAKPKVKRTRPGPSGKRKLAGTDLEWMRIGTGKEYVLGAFGQDIVVVRMRDEITVKCARSGEILLTGDLLEFTRFLQCLRLRRTGESWDIVKPRSVK